MTTNVLTINDQTLSIKEWNNQRVITLKDVDTVHKRPEGTARKRFNDNKQHFIDGEDYYNIKLTTSEIRTAFNVGNRITSIIVLTETGYLMLVKSFTDKLAWEVQRQLVKCYFKVKPQFQQQPQNCSMLDRTIQTLQQAQQMLTECSLEQGHVLQEHESKIEEHEKSISDLNQFKQEVKTELQQLKQPKQKPKAKQENISKNDSKDRYDYMYNDAIKMRQVYYSGYINRLIKMLASARHELVGMTWNYIASKLYENENNLKIMGAAVLKEARAKNLKQNNFSFSCVVYDKKMRALYSKTIVEAMKEYGL